MRGAVVGREAAEQLNAVFAGHFQVQHDDGRVPLPRRVHERGRIVCNDRLEPAGLGDPFNDFQEAPLVIDHQQAVAEDEEVVTHAGFEIAIAHVPFSSASADPRAARSTAASSALLYGLLSNCKLPRTSPLPLTLACGNPEVSTTLTDGQRSRARRANSMPSRPPGMTTSVNNKSTGSRCSISSAVTARPHSRTR